MKKTTLLLVEDEAAIRDMLRFSLSDQNFKIIDAADSTEAIRQLADTIPDLILLDWMLPGKSGIEFIQWIKAQVNLRDIPIIMLTAKAEETNKVKGLTTGADDYITKPFSPQELIARIKAVLRRGLLASPNDIIQCKNLILDFTKHQVTINNKLLELSPIEYNMLAFFMRHPNKTYNREQLLTHIWSGDTYINDRSVDVQIRRLRDKLKPDHHHLIKTIRGAGYQFSEDSKDDK